MSSRLRVAMIAPFPASAMLPPECIKPRYRAEHPAPWVNSLARSINDKENVIVMVVAHSRAVTRLHEVTLGDLRYLFLPKREPIRSDPYHLYWPGRLQVHPHLKKWNPDLVVGFGTENECGAIAATSGFPSVVFLQGLVDQTAPFISEPAATIALKRHFERMTVRRSDGIIAETEFARAWALKQDPAAVVRVIPHPVNPIFFDVRADHAEPRVLFAGTLNRTKAPDVALRAFAQMAPSNARLAIAGDGPLRDECQHEAIRLGIADRVEFLGHIPANRLAEEMSRARLLLITSRMDTAPNIVTEAHAAGLPVVGTRAGGIPDLVEHERDGLLAERDDIPALSAALSRLLADPHTGRRMGESGRAKVMYLNSPDRIASAHVDFYREVLRFVDPRTLRRTLRPIRQTPLVRRIASWLPRSWRNGPAYREWRAMLTSAREWPADERRAWQMEHLRRIVRIAYEEAPGYRKLYDEAGVHPDHLRSLDDLAKFPFITKTMLQENLERFSTGRRPRRYVTTSGSTGIPFGVYHRAQRGDIEQAFMHDSWTRVGWRAGERMAVLRGGFVGSAEHVCEYDPYRRELQLSSYYLTRHTLELYVRAWKQYGIRILQAYPSAVDYLCVLLQESGWRLDPAPRLILLGSENIYPEQLRLLEQTFPGAHLHAWYGHAEQAVLAPWCREERRYHVDPFYGIAEVLDDKDQPVPPGGEGEIVATSLHNLCTPLIRYRTMDRAVRGTNGCSWCGAGITMLDQIVGRSHEIIHTAAGRRISMTAINMHDAIFDPLRQFQFLQEERGRVTFKYIPKRPLFESEIGAIVAGLRAKLGDDMKLELKEVTSIPRAPSGKFMFLDQRYREPERAG